MRRRYQQIASKWKKHQALLNSPSLHYHIPEMRPFTLQALEYLLYRHGAAFFKPDRGDGGAGIVQIRLDPSETSLWFHQNGGNRQIPISEGYQWLTGEARNRAHIIQQNICPIFHTGRPLDFRVLLQRIKDSWEVTGMCARIAAKGEVVTNLRRGGRPLPLDSVVGGGAEGVHWLQGSLSRLGVEVANTLTRTYRGLRELGLDVVMNDIGRMWILEVNTRPRFNIFRLLSTRQTYRLIMRNHRRILHTPAN